MAFGSLIRPGREDFRQVLFKAMPRMLGSEQIPAKDEMREIIRRVTPRMWKRDKARLLDLLQRL